ncbi:hypothetical protein J6590_077561 [Homalodisca vitripennis]|nr:hypothetical protein J6590_077561 [Homalodisca vitripennis]
MATATVVNGIDHNGDVPFESEEYDFHEDSEASPDQADTTVDDDGELPQCKIRRNYACPECSYFTQNPRFFLYHLKNVHKQKIRIYECPNCLYASKHSQKLQRHVQMVHAMGGDKKRDAAKSSPKPSPQYSPPEEEEEEEEEEDEDVGDPKENGENRALPDNKVYRCPSCPFTSRMQTLVTRHEKVVHLKKKFFKCVKCNYVTHMKARFTKHVKYHSMPMIKCEMCDFKTPYKWNLDRHMKNHMSDGAFKCSLCNFTADIKQSLTVHEMNHHVPPVGHVAGNKRKNRVGASDLQEQDDDVPVDHDREDAELLRLEREGEIHQAQSLPNKPHSNVPVNMKRWETKFYLGSEPYWYRIGSIILPFADVTPGVCSKNDNRQGQGAICRFLKKPATPLMIMQEPKTRAYLLRHCHAYDSAVSSSTLIRYSNNVLTYVLRSNSGHCNGQGLK